MEANLSYYKRRSAEKGAAAATADNSVAREAHLELARRYDGEIARLHVELKRASFTSSGLLNRYNMRAPA